MEEHFLYTLIKQLDEKIIYFKQQIEECERGRTAFLSVIDGAPTSQLVIKDDEKGEPVSFAATPMPPSTTLPFLHPMPYMAQVVFSENPGRSFKFGSLLEEINKRFPLSATHRRAANYKTLASAVAYFKKQGIATNEHGGWRWIEGSASPVAPHAPMPLAPAKERKLANQHPTERGIAAWLKTLFADNPTAVYRFSELRDLSIEHLGLRGGGDISVQREKRAPKIASALNYFLKSGRIINISHGKWQANSDFLDKDHAVVTQEEVISILKVSPHDLFTSRELVEEIMLRRPLKSGVTQRRLEQAVSNILSKLKNTKKVEKMGGGLWRLYHVEQRPVKPLPPIHITQTPILLAAPPTISDSVKVHLECLRTLFTQNGLQDIDRDYLKDYLREEFEERDVDFNESSMVAALTSLQSQRHIKKVATNVWRLASTREQSE